MSARILRFLTPILLLVSITGCATAPPVITAPPPAPAPVVEQVPPQPGPGYVWVEGHWAWRPRFARYAWVPGHWVVPESPGAVWVPGHWVARANGYVWVDGHWRAH